MLISEHRLVEILSRSITEALKPTITILWLDDMRDPQRYFSKKIQKPEGALYNNINYYQNNVFPNYEPKFVWVKTYNEFCNYIIANGIPEFVSFDYDLGKGQIKGGECARWLLDYCKENGQKFPRFYIHSANHNGQREIGNLLNGIS